METHCLLSRMNIGTLKKLRGKLLFVNVYVSDNEYKWTNGEIEEKSQKLFDIFDYLKKCINEENVFFEYYVSSYYLNINYPFERTSCEKWLKDFANGFDCLNLKNVHDKMYLKYDVDQVAFLFITKRPSLCYAISAKESFYDFCEFAVLYGENYNSVIHEILHLFGAADLYFPKEISDVAKEMFPKSIMFNSTYNKIDDFTKYVVGIHEKPSSLAKTFIDRTKNINCEYIENSIKGQWQDGFRRVTYAGGMVYEGNFKNGMREGMGKVYYTDGSIYEGEFKNNKIEGFGKLFFANGALYEGEFKNNKRSGIGKLIYPNKVIYEGEFKDNEYNGQGKLTYPSGKTYEGEFKNGKIVKNKR